MIDLNTATMDEGEPRHYYTEASECGMRPGDWPLYLRLDGEIITRASLDETGAGYVGLKNILTVFND